MRWLLRVAFGALVFITLGFFALMCFALDDIYQVVHRWWRGLLITYAATVAVFSRERVR
jgi:hypothetical protein